LVATLEDIPAPILAADLPTGMDSDTGQAEGPVVCAHTTVTLGMPKVGMLFHPGCVLVGDVVVADIGLPRELAAPPERGVELLETGDLATFLPAIPSTAHKGDCGRILVIAGSTGMSGAAALCCQAALRTGAGLVYLAIPEHLNAVLETMLPEVITLPLPQHDGQHCELGFAQLSPRLEGFDAVVIGPGLGRGSGPTGLLATFLSSWRGPTVLDADALFHVHAEALFSEKVVLTPHLGEMSRLTGEAAPSIRLDLLGSARREAARRRAVVVLKGVPTVVAAPEGQTGVNLTGNAGLATGGSGDVLAGMIAGFMGQGAAAYRAALAGAYAHGLAADLAAAEMPHASIVPTDLIGAIPKALGVAGFGDRSEPSPWWKHPTPTRNTR
jgi:NAD(P)H-hydrate epimerase